MIAAGAVAAVVVLAVVLFMFMPSSGPDGGGGGGPGSTYDVTYDEFVNDLENQNWSELVGDGSGLRREAQAVLVTTDQDGQTDVVPISNEVQTITLQDDITGGTFTLQYDTYPTTEAIPAV